VTEITQILTAIQEGQPQASEQLLPLVYQELHQLAVSKMARETPGQTLQATALVHEAYLRLVDTADPQLWNSRGHFFAAAAEAMRRILVERARHKQTIKGGSQQQRHELREIAVENTGSDVDILALHEALEKLEKEDPRRAQVVKLKFFAGLKIDEMAQTLKVSTTTVENDWAYARCWLRLAMTAEASNSSTNP
jgi:RNA polymerase sigma factor (TIGR02999 family)